MLDAKSAFQFRHRGRGRADRGRYRGAVWASERRQTEADFEGEAELALGVIATVLPRRRHLTLISQRNANGPGQIGVESSMTLAIRKRSCDASALPRVESISARPLDGADR